MPIVESDVRDLKTLTVDLPRDTMRRLRHYSAFSKAKPARIVRTALDRLFEQDTEFAPWVAKQAPQAPGRKLRAAAGDDELSDDSATASSAA